VRSQLKKSPKAAHEVDCEPTPAELIHDAVNAQTRYFPAWWTLIGTPRHSAPVYRVVCRSQGEIELAQALQPDVVDAEYVLAEDCDPSA
jgi:hypothetical protein